MRAGVPVLLTGLLTALSPGVTAAGGLFDSLSAWRERFGLAPARPAFLAPDEAFVFAAEVRDAQTITVRWQIADGYYLYRDKFSFRLRGGQTVSLGAPVMPSGEMKEDETFGLTEVYRGQVEIGLPVRRRRDETRHVVLDVAYQGCADQGFCYPPMTQTVGLLLAGGG